MFKLTHDGWTRNIRAAVSYGTMYGAYFHGGHSHLPTLGIKSKYKRKQTRGNLTRASLIPRLLRGEEY